MTSSNPPFRQPPKSDPVDKMLDEWRQIKAEGRADKQPDPAAVLGPLELMMLLLKRP